MSADLTAFLDEVIPGLQRVVFLTGAGVSAESGIPTFRGPEGYWSVGSREYTPMEMATRAMFARQPETVWAWYLHRRSICCAARPNAAHEAIARLARSLGEQMLLVTQNVDGLHLRAGSPRERTYQIHGNLDLVRCSAGCDRSLRPFPLRSGEWARGRALDAESATLLRCGCGAWLRPHVLWFDETYDEEHFHFDSARHAAALADLLVVVGTAGATNLPRIMGSLALDRGAIVIDVNSADNPFRDLARRSARGHAATGLASELVPIITHHLEETMS